MGKDSKERKALIKKINDLTAARNRLNEEIDEVVFALIRLDVKDKRATTDEAKLFRWGTKVTIRMGDLDGRPGMIIRRISKRKDLGEKTHWEFQVLGGPASLMREVPAIGTTGQMRTMAPSIVQFFHFADAYSLTTVVEPPPTSTQRIGALKKLVNMPRDH